MQLVLSLARPSGRSCEVSSGGMTNLMCEGWKQLLPMFCSSLFWACKYAQGVPYQKYPLLCASFEVAIIDVGELWHSR
jgi:hypothetical protein